MYLASVFAITSCDVGNCNSSSALGVGGRGGPGGDRGVGRHGIIGGTSGMGSIQPSNGFGMIMSLLECTASGIGTSGMGAFVRLPLRSDPASMR